MLSLRLAPHHFFYLFSKQTQRIVPKFLDAFTDTSTDGVDLCYLVRGIADVLNNK
jgi:hypothetical protein